MNDKDNGISKENQVGVPYAADCDCCMAWWVQLSDGRFYGFDTEAEAVEAARNDQG